MAEIGHLPCFQDYLHGKFPLVDFYQKPSYVTKVKNLLSALVESKSPQELKQNISANDIKPIRPTSSEGKKLIKICRTPLQLYRIDYGNNPFRVVFAFEKATRLALIYIIDTKHATMRRKHK